MGERSVAEVELAVALGLICIRLAVESLHFRRLSHRAQHHFAAACVGSILPIELTGHGTRHRRQSLQLDLVVDQLGSVLAAVWSLAIVPLRHNALLLSLSRLTAISSSS